MKNFVELLNESPQVHALRQELLNLHLKAVRDQAALAELTRLQQLPLFLAAVPALAELIKLQQLPQEPEQVPGDRQDPSGEAE